MKIAFIGCVAFSAAALEHLLQIPEAQVVGVITRRASGFNADFADLGPIVDGTGIPCIRVAGRGHEAMLAALREWRPDAVYCFGWSYLLDREILDLPPLGVIGFHPAALPQNRGRHPIIWALALGLERTASTFFRMRAQADAGPIVDQREIEINGSDDAGSLYLHITEVALEQISVFTPALANGSLRAIVQDEADASYWRKRGAADGLIDWRMPAQGIVNLVRALASPYPGADCRTPQGMAKIFRARLHPHPVAANQEPGKVLGAGAARLLVKCGDGAVDILEHSIHPLPEEGSYL